MDAADDNPGGLWTNERHMRYLRSMEASFVRTTFGDEDNGRLLRLDRYMPDSAESTLDLKKIRRHSTSDIPEQGIRSRSGDKKTRRQSFQQHTSLQDQVVPQLEFGTGGKDVRGHSVRLPAAPAN